MASSAPNNGTVGIRLRSGNDITSTTGGTYPPLINDLEFWVVQTNALLTPANLDLSSGSDPGVSNSDNLTSAASLTFTAQELGAEIATLYVDKGVNGRAGLVDHR